MSIVCNPMDYSLQGSSDHRGYRQEYTVVVAHFRLHAGSSDPGFRPGSPTSTNKILYPLSHPELPLSSMVCSIHVHLVSDVVITILSSASPFSFFAFNFSIIRVFANDSALHIRQPRVLKLQLYLQLQ